MFRNLRPLGSHLGGTCAERHSTNEGSIQRPTAALGAGSIFSQKDRGHLSRGLPRGSAHLPLPTRATYDLDSSERPDLEEPTATTPSTVRVALCVGLEPGSFPSHQQSQGERAGRFLRPPSPQQVGSAVCASALHPGSPPTAGPPSLTPFSSPTKPADNRGQSLSTTHTPQVVVWRRIWNLGKVVETTGLLAAVGGVDARSLG